MGDCSSCGAAFDCVEPEIGYSLEAQSFPFITICPDGVVCAIGEQFHLICCDHTNYDITFNPNLSQEDKQGVINSLIAECARKLAFCGDKPPCPTPPCDTLWLYWNQAQTCIVKCPDGSTFRYTQPASTVIGFSFIEANAYAFNLACQKARDHRICLSNLSGAHCADEPVTLTIKGTGNYLASPPGSDFWDLVSGSIPTGMTFNGGFRSDRKCVIDGTPTTAGVYTFTVRVTVYTFGPAFGDYSEREYTVIIAGISPATLPDATIGTAYTQNLTVGPAHDQETEVWTLLTSLPAGLEMTDAGVIHGTPTGPSESHDVEVQVDFTLDGKKVTCTKDYTLTVNDNSITPIEYWKMEESNSDRIGQVQGIHLQQQFGVNIPAIAGKILNCARFVGSGFPYPYLAPGPTYFEPKLKNLGTGFALVGWFNMVTAPGLTATLFPAINFYDGSDNSFGFAALEIRGAPANVVSVVGRDSNNTLYSTTQISLTINAWTFFRLWFDTVSGKVKLQINNLTTVESAGGLVFAPSASGSIDIASDNAGYELRVDELGVYMPALTDTQADTIYNLGAGKTCCPFT